MLSLKQLRGRTGSLHAPFVAPKLANLAVGYKPQRATRAQEAATKPQQDAPTLVYADLEFLGGRLGSVRFVGANAVKGKQLAQSTGLQDEGYKGKPATCVTRREAE